MKSPFLDAVWVLLITLSVLLFYIRKVILAQHGYGFSFSDFWLTDGANMRNLIAAMPEGIRRKVYAGINKSVVPLFLISLALAFAVHVIPAVWLKWKTLGEWRVDPSRYP